MDRRLRGEDLAPGDRAAAARPWDDVSVHAVTGAADPDFALAYERLWSEFGALGEMERRRVIEERLAWDPARPRAEAALGPEAGAALGPEVRAALGPEVRAALGPEVRAALLYELLVLRRGGVLAALRDHSAVVRLDAAGRALPGPVVVHLSHAYVVPEQRGSGLAAWLRALPLEAARRCARAAGCEPGRAIVLVAEMEPPDPARPQRLPRLRSYERAGFLKLDPEAAPYAQPDFRELPPGEAPEPVPLSLVLRRVGREGEREMPAAEVAAVVASIYAVYAVHTASAALDPLREAAAAWTGRRASFRLLPPTA